MPVHTNKIDIFEFLSMDGTVFERQQELELINRGGVNGTGARRLGLRGKPFEIVTRNYEESFQSAANKMAEYIQLKNDADLVALQRHSVPIGFVLILEVKERVTPYAIFNSIGGIQDDPLDPVNLECCHEVVWTLLL